MLCCPIFKWNVSIKFLKTRRPNRNCCFDIVNSPVKFLWFSVLKFSTLFSFIVYIYVCLFCFNCYHFVLIKVFIMWRKGLNDDLWYLQSDDHCTVSQINGVRLKSVSPFNEQRLLQRSVEKQKMWQFRAGLRRLCLSDRGDTIICLLSKNKKTNIVVVPNIHQTIYIRQTDNGLQQLLPLNQTTSGLQQSRLISCVISIEHC